MRVVRTSVLLAAALWCVACTSTGDTTGSETTSDGVAIRDVTIPAERLTPFCQRMLELDDELPDDPAIDATDTIVAAYREAMPLAPPEIAEEFGAVLAALESGSEATFPPRASSPTTSDAAADTTVPTTNEATGSAPSVPASSLAPPSAEEAYPEEGYLPDDTPGARVNAYIDFACRGTVNNPGPSATQPAAPPTT